MQLQLNFVQHVYMLVGLQFVLVLCMFTKKGDIEPYSAYPEFIFVFV